MIQTHSQVGHDIIKPVEFPWPVADMILQHHERMDGSGYPNRLKGDSIIFEAHILVVADVVEAMASHRPYRPARGLAEALNEIRKGTAEGIYNPEVARTCLRLFEVKGYQMPPSYAD
jgi:HD-GYP domain-containing protein (c-di-GMP phosphodiesterase class II)